MSKRERYIAIAAAVAVGLFAFDYIVLSPLLSHRDDVQKRMQAAVADEARATQVIDRGRQMSKRWKEMTTAGLTPDASGAEGQALHALRDWATDSGMALTSLKPERVEHVKQFNVVTIRATATGGLNSVGKFLHRIQTANMPIRVADLTLTARKEGTDDLGVQLGIETVALAPPDKKPGAAIPARPAGASNSPGGDR